MQLWGWIQQTWAACPILASYVNTVGYAALFVAAVVAALWLWLAREIFFRKVAETETVPSKARSRLTTMVLFGWLVIGGLGAAAFLLRQTIMVDWLGIGGP